MASVEDIRSSLEWAMTQKPLLTVMRLLNVGDYIQKGTDFWIHIDETACLAPLRRSSGLDLVGINRFFIQRQTIHGENKYYVKEGVPYKHGFAVPLSQLIRDRVGECTEMSVVAQLLAQEMRRESFWVSGLFCNDGQCLTFHAWTVMEKGGVFWIFDPAQMCIVQVLDVQQRDGSVHLLTQGTEEYSLN